MVACDHQLPAGVKSGFCHRCGMRVAVFDGDGQVYALATARVVAVIPDAPPPMWPDPPVYVSGVE